MQNNSISVAGGEPFVKEDIDEFIIYFDKKKIPCSISTNGWFTEKIADLTECLEDTNTVKFMLDKDTLSNGDLIKITISTNLNWIPAKAGMGNDNRCLGLAIRNVAIN